MSIKSIVEEIKKLTPEERAVLGEVFGASSAPSPAAVEVDEEAVAGLMADLKRYYPKLEEPRIRKMAVERVAKGKERREPKPPKAGTVYFFLQTARIDVQDIVPDKDDPSVLRITGYALPDRVIAVDGKAAARLYWKQRNRYGYIGRSSGEAWAKARADGLNVIEAQAVEYEAMRANPDKTPPPNREKTFFAGTKASSISQGREISWAQGLQQNRPGGIE